MNLLISIDEEIYRHAQNVSEDSNDEWNAMRAIANGTLIPDNATNWINDMKLGAKIALQGVKEMINDTTEEMKRKDIDTKYFTPIKAFIDDKLSECEINEER